jgi:ATP synthase protein I
VDLTEVRRLAFRIVLGQAAVTVLVALVSLMLGGARAALSALLGGGISTAATLTMALVAFGGLAQGGAYRVMGAFLLGEVLKLAVTVTLFVIVLQTMTVSPGAWFAAYGATFLVYWIALAALLSSSTTTGRRG